MPQFSPEERHAIMAAVDALLLQISARVPLYQTAAGTVLVPLHPLLDTLGLDLLLEATALTLLRPQAYMVAEGATALLVPLGEAFALLPLSRHFPEALDPVLQIVAVRTAAETRAASIPSAPTHARRPQPKRAPARARGARPARDASPLTAGRSVESRTPQPDAAGGSGSSRKPLVSMGGSLSENVHITY
jgi:hypothetical protein